MWLIEYNVKAPYEFLEVGKLRRFFFYSLIVHLSIVVVSVALQRTEVIARGSIAVFVGTVLIAGSIVRGARGWEFLGTTQEEQKEMFAYRNNQGLKALAFLIPNLITIGLYAYLIGF
ncbi:MAG TPA: hypothetical protein VFC74_06695 [Oscillospiraceae bacterium]|nr:hypothetical protein [Oscillospiraceae bacterium]